MSFLTVIPGSVRPLFEFPWKINEANTTKGPSKSEQLAEFTLTIVRVAACAATFIATARMGLTLKNCALSTAALSLLSEGAGDMLMGSFIFSYGISAAGVAIASKTILSQATLKAAAIFAASYIKFNNKINNEVGVFERHVFKPIYEKIRPTLEGRFFSSKAAGKAAKTTKEASKASKEGKTSKASKANQTGGRSFRKMFNK